MEGYRMPTTQHIADNPANRYLLYLRRKGKENDPKCSKLLEQLRAIKPNKISFDLAVQIEETGVRISEILGKYSSFKKFKQKYNIH